MDPDDKKTSLLLKIEPPKIADLIISKQTHYYTLWGGYTVVQFTAGSFGYSGLPLGVGLAVLLGVWAFNLGHLGFVLRCVAQLNRLSAVLTAVVDEDPKRYEDNLRKAFEDMQEGSFFWRFLARDDGPRSYRMNIFVHFFIDVCASVALLVRVDNDFVRQYVPSFLQAVP